MINRIDYIKDFGIYKDFNWSSSNDIVDFKQKNIIYGWNYSGKTTFSRVFSSLRDKSLFNDFKNGDFKVSTEDNGSFSKSNIDRFPIKILVFNSDYVRENLRWELDDQINAIYFEVGEDAKRAKRIEELENKIISIKGSDEVKGTKEPYEKQVAIFKEFDQSHFTNESRRIKNDVFSSLIEFNKGNFKKQIPYVIQDLNGFILNKTEVSKISKVVKIEEPKPAVELIDYDLALNNIIKSVNDILIKHPEKSDIIPILEKNPEIFDWVKEGMDLNKTGENCLFCDNIITQDRMLLLNKFYENEGSKLKEESERLFQIIEEEKEKIKALNFPNSLQEINDGFQDQYIKIKKSIDKKLKSYKSKLDVLHKKLRTKVNSHLYAKMDPIAERDFTTLESELVSLNKLISQNNLFTSDFDSLIKSERNKYINHLVAKYLKENKYLSKQKKYERAVAQIQKLDAMVSTFQKEVDRLEAMKNSGEEGCQQFNYFTQSFLGKEDIEVIFDKVKKKFSIRRGEEIARNLSEGEKMAISFSHFLVTLKSIDDKNELGDYILFIDDPMSSLDGNHIFQINALLKDFLFQRGLDTANPQKWVQKCRQLFISTHNFEFFNLLKEMPSQNGLRYSSKGTKGDECRYFISRKVNESSLEKLPSVYDSYKSEYHYLFKTINEFNKNSSPEDSDMLLLMPNILRRFLEIYTLAKYPSTDEVDDRATEIFGAVSSKRICKPFHYFSHFNNIDRIGKQSEFLADIKIACKELITKIKEDKQHYKALQSVI